MARAMSISAWSQISISKSIPDSLVSALLEEPGITHGSRPWV
uniref:Uncharacterized protein n=1 Tax=Vitis vinifera TaxID=29760 RepID=F6GYY3_VITVI